MRIRGQRTAKACTGVCADGKQAGSQRLDSADQVVGTEGYAGRGTLKRASKTFHDRLKTAHTSSSKRSLQGMQRERGSDRRGWVGETRERRMMGAGEGGGLTSLPMLDDGNSRHVTCSSRLQARLALFLCSLRRP